jgi:serine/threonine protein kinase
MTSIQLNSVKERLLFLSPAVQFGLEKEASLEDFEKIGDLGQGGWGTVKKMKHRRSQIIYALKLISKTMLKNHEMSDQIKTEIKIMYGLTHEHIIKLFNHFEDDNYVYLAIEFAAGGQLWDKMMKTDSKRLPEKQVAMYIKELVSSLEYLHGKGIIHRDIKPENLLIDHQNHIKLADFGWSNFLNPGVARTTFCGTNDYLAPEMLTKSHSHDHMVDVWSVGVLIYELLTGKAPFAPTDTYGGLDVEKVTQENINNCKIDFPKDFPALAKDLIQKILKKNPKTRIGLQEIKNHAWIKFNTQGTKSDKDPNKAIADVAFGQSLAQFKQVNQMDTKALGINAAFTEEEIIQIVRPDSLLDKSGIHFQGNKGPNAIDMSLQKFKNELGLSGMSTIASTNSSTTSNGNFSATNYNFDYALKPTPAYEPSQTTPTGAMPTPVVSSYTSPYSEMSPKVGGFHDTAKVNQSPTPSYSDFDQINRLKQVEAENMMLRMELSQAGDRMREKDIKLQTLEVQYKAVDELYKTSNPSGNKDLFEGAYLNLKKQFNELENSNTKLRFAVTEYEKAITNAYSTTLPTISADNEKRKLLEDNKLLILLLQFKQELLDNTEKRILDTLNKRQ